MSLRETPSMKEAIRPGSCSPSSSGGGGGGPDCSCGARWVWLCLRGSGGGVIAGRPSAASAAVRRGTPTAAGEALAAPGSSETVLTPAVVGLARLGVAEVGAVRAWLAAGVAAISAGVDVGVAVKAGQVGGD